MKKNFKYSFENYSIVFSDTTTKHDVDKKNCLLELSNNKEVLWMLQLSFSKENCIIGNLLNMGSTKNNSIRAVKELDLLTNFLEKHLNKMGVRKISGRTILFWLDF